MSLLLRSSLPVFVNIGLVFADNADNGGLDGGVDDDDQKTAKNTKKATARTEKTETEKTEAEKTKTIQTGTDTQTTAKNTATNAETNAETNTAAVTGTAQGTGVSYNQWGFTGSQSRWEDITKANSDVSSGSDSMSASSTPKRSKNKTSNAIRIKPSYAEGNWKHSAFLGAIVAVTMALHCL